MSQIAPRSPISALGLFIWSLTALFFLYEFFLRTFVGSLAHQVIPDLGLSAERFAMIGSAYYLTQGIMQVPVGLLTDKFGVKVILVFACLVCAAATFLFASSTGFTSAFISRALMGFGSSFAFVCLLVVAGTWFPRRFFGFFVGLSQFIGTMGPLLAAGPLIAFMTQAELSWRDALHVVAVVGIVLAVLMLLFVKNKGRDPQDKHIVLKQTPELSSRLSQLFSNKQAWCVAAYSATIYASMALLGAIWGTEYLQVRGLSQAEAANIISISWLGYAAACPILGVFSDIAKRRKPILIFCALLALVATSGIIFLPETHFWLFGLLFFSLGIAAAGQSLGFATISEHVSPESRASALGLNNGAIMLFSAVIPPITSYFISRNASTEFGQFNVNDFTLGFMVMPVLSFIALMIAWFCIDETFCKPQKEMITLVKE